MDDERTLVAQASRHNAQAFSQLYGRYVNKIHKYICFKVGSTVLAEDMTAQVFLNAWVAIGEYCDTNRPFSAWLYRIAHNLVVDYFRRHHETVSLEDYAYPVEDRGNVEELVEKGLNDEMIRNVISRLTVDQQQVLTYRFLHGYSTYDLADMMGKDPGAVRSLQHRGLRALERILNSNDVQMEDVKSAMIQ